MKQKRRRIYCEQLETRSQSIILFFSRIYYYLFRTQSSQFSLSFGLPFPSFSLSTSFSLNPSRLFEMKKRGKKDLKDKKQKLIEDSAPLWKQKKEFGPTSLL